MAEPDVTVGKNGGAPMGVESAGGYEMMLLEAIRDLRATMEDVGKQVAANTAVVNACEAKSIGGGLWGRSILPTWLLVFLCLMTASMGGINIWSVVTRGVTVAVPTSAVAATK